MPKKQEERDWSEIIAEVRAKAKSDIDDLVEDIRPRVQALVNKVREANFHEEAEELLAKLKSLADDFSKSQDDGPAKSRSVKSAGTGTRKETFKYLDDKGNTYKRPPRAEGKQWTEAQKKKYRSAYIKKFGES